MNFDENQELVIAISTDQLYIVKTDKKITDPEKELSLLLNGKDNKLNVLSGPPEQIFSLIDDCYTARANNNEIYIRTATEFLNFK